MSILIIDNYDSFTYNLVDLIHRSSTAKMEVVVKRNDAITPSEVESLSPSHIIISPGPGTPRESGVSKSVIEDFYRDIPILGVCLGHQIICEVFGATITRAPAPMHGKAYQIHHCGSGCFEGVPSPFTVARYHSLVACGEMKDLVITARCDDLIMGVSHVSAPLHGVQFHPESFMTDYGTLIMRNFLSL